MELAEKRYVMKLIRLLYAKVQLAETRTELEAAIKIADKLPRELRAIWDLTRTKKD